MNRTISASTPVRGQRLVAGVVSALVVTTSFALMAPAQAQGDGTAVHPRLVSTDPADFTPFVKDGIVESVVQVGNQIVIGGTFTQVVRGTTTFTRSGLAAFDATTGAVSTAFAPTLNGEVTSLEVSADGASVYAAGAFSTVNGVTRKKLALVKVADGSLVSAFKAKGVTARVNDVRRVGNTLWIAGQFAKVEGQSRGYLATVNATTGALTNQSTLVFSGKHNEVSDPAHAGSTNIREIAISPDNTKLLAVGNFTKVNGATRDQVALIDISGPTATLSGWQTSFFSSVCNTRAFDTVMRDVAISPDGTYAVFATTGSYRANTSCDTVSRLEISGSSSGVTPTWINMTGGDTTTAVAIVGSVVYTGGHFRWSNNPSAGDKPGQGAIERTGLAALDPVNGMPYDWNPTRERGYGVYDFLATSEGLWVGSDTDTLGSEYHPRIGFFPLAAGSAIPGDPVGSLPGDVLSVSPGAASSNAVTTTDVSASGAPGATSTVSTGDSWSNARGAMIVGNTLYTAWSDRGLYASPLSGNSVGPRSLVNLNAGPACTSSSGTCLNAFSVDVPSITGMFYDSGRMYYTMSGSSSLYYRYFLPESGYVGGSRFTASGSISTLNPTRVRGMFLSGSKVYFADSTNGRLSSIGFAGGVVSGGVVEVDATRDWRARGLAVSIPAPANQAPVAAFTSSCTFLACSFNSSASSDDGAIVSRSWTFGDSETGSGTSPSHAYGSADSYAVTLTVTDNGGLQDSVTKNVTVSDVPASAVTFRGASSAYSSGGNANVDVPGSVQPDDLLVLSVTANGSTSLAAPAGWTLLGTEEDGSPDLLTQVWTRRADSGDAGSTVSVTVSSTQKTTATVLAYSGVDAGSPPAYASASEQGSSAAHASPSVAVTEAGSWVVVVWAEKSTGSTTWSVPGSLSQREVVVGSGGGAVSTVSADSGGPVPVGTWPGAAATASTSGSKATAFSIVLAPA